MKRVRDLPLLVLAILLVIDLGAIAAVGDRQTPDTRSVPAHTESNTGSVSVELEEVLTGFTQPTQVTNAGDGSNRLFVVERQGRILVAVDGEVQPEPFLDIRDEVGDWFIEQGLFSIAFHPNYAENGYFYVFYTAEPVGAEQQERNSGDNTIARFQVSADNPNQADHDSATIVLAIPDREANHNGGQLRFGPDGYLYAGTGDEGGQGARWNNSQDPESYFGKILRLDVDGGEPYAIPADNPFVEDDDYLSEIWALGLRNPWRFSFDRATGDMYIADVGEHTFEEVNLIPVGESAQNFGWPIMEGNTCYPAEEACDQADLTMPIHDYPHTDGDIVNGCSATGGYVYRGSETPFMEGLYVFGDWCSAKVWAMTERDAAWEKDQIGQFDFNLSAFGEDEAGELYLADMANGRVMRMHFASVDD